MPADLAPGIAAWLPTAAAAIGPLDVGVDLEAMSVQDWHDREDKRTERGVRQGYGTLIARLAEGLAVSVNARVRRIASPAIALRSKRSAVRCGRMQRW